MKNIVFGIHCVVVQLLLVARHGVGQSVLNFTQLLDTFPDFPPLVRPVNDSCKSTNVSVSFHLISLSGFDFVNQKLSSNGYFNVTWVNEYLTWDPDDYGGIQRVFLPPQDYWQPGICLMNTYSSMEPIGVDYSRMDVWYNGIIYWYPAETLDTACQVDVTYFPFDVQRCEVKLFVPVQSIEEIDLHLGQCQIGLETFQKNGEWEVLSTRAWRRVLSIYGGHYPFLHFELTLRRRPTLLVLTVMLPVTVLSVINVFVFTVPSEAGERLGFSMTAVLSFGVFMSFVLDAMPSSTETIPIGSIYMSSLLVLSAVYVLLCILSLRLFHRDSSKHPVPGLLQTVVVWLELIVCLDPPSKTSKVDAFGLQTDKYLDESIDGRARTNDTLTVSATLGGLQSKDVLKASGGDVQGRLDGTWTGERRAAAYSNPDEMTWQRVSRTIDKLFFRFFFLFAVIFNLVVWVMVVSNFTNTT